MFFAQSSPATAVHPPVGATLADWNCSFVPAKVNCLGSLDHLSSGKGTATRVTPIPIVPPYSMIATGAACYDRLTSGLCILPRPSPDWTRTAIPMRLLALRYVA